MTTAQWAERGGLMRTRVNVERITCDSCGVKYFHFVETDWRMIEMDNATYDFCPGCVGALLHIASFLKLRMDITFRVEPMDVEKEE